MAFAAFFSLAPFILISGVMQISGDDLGDHTFTYFFYVIFFAAFSAQLFAALSDTGFVAVIMLASLLFSFVLQIVVIGAIWNWFGLTQQMFLQHQFWLEIKKLLFSAVLMTAFIAVTAIPFGLDGLPLELKAMRLQKLGRAFSMHCLSLAQQLCL